MLVLALDTTSEKGGVAIYQDSECLTTVENRGPANVYSVSLFQMVAQALEGAGIRPSPPGGTALRSTEQGAVVHPIADEAPLAGLSAMDLFAVANGPGSFTGIRIGTAAVQAWARAFGRPVRGVSVLEAMVEEASPNSAWAVPILDARRGEFFLGCFRRAEPEGANPGAPPPALYQPEDEGWVLSPGDLQTFLGERLTEGAEVTCLVRESDGAALALRAGLPKSYGWETVAGTLLRAIARLGLKAHQRGMTQEPQDLHACYIRRPDAEVNWRE